jgi:putative ATP-dependent endonuclease of OLD family
VKYVQRILNNQEADFTTVLKSAFNIDLFIGQSIIATHSPSILLNDYTQIIRLYKKDGTLKIKSGINVDLHHGLKKQLQMQFPFIKEAFFSRCVIVVEGESEISSFPLFAQKINPEQDFDELGISVIKAGGEKSVQPILDLLGKFDIPALGIIDKDLDSGNKYPNIKKTTEQDFEAEIIKLLDDNKEDTLKSILIAYDSQGIERELMKEALLVRFSNYSSIIDQTLSVTTNIKLSDIAETNTALKKLWYITWLSINKNILLGATVGECLLKEEIPQCYVDVIKTAIELSKNG